MTVTTSQDEQLGAAIGAIPSGLFIVTSQQNGKTATMLASWVQQAGFNPPSVTIIVGKGRPIESFLTVGSPVVINIAEKGNGKIIGHFAKGFAPDVDPFDGLETATAPSGQSFLTEAIAYLDATVTGSLDAGDHSVILATITAGDRLRDGEPAIHTRKNGFKY
ncbi:MULTISPECIES: flavin reductase family protein [Pseudanabaena]|uniref:flavin reductase family protein n=1 Tax=Pseudanabaena TaxID=1152 RepID=UPI002479C42B|nr:MULTISPECIES: flavin reductase family protein [Pseudanabaena]MEA5487225.1 flavin reductase family protein [Pseudanabaena sp. CCNP1317]WGS70444.1 flavin reductase family protein [Pseudanabaena galeata CCNP1313]